MSNLPLVLVPGLCCTGDMYAHQALHLGRNRAVMLANHWRADTMGAIADQILAEAPERFALSGASMGGYVAFEILRRAPERVDRVAFICTSARPDTPERSVQRRKDLEVARHDLMAGIDAFLPALVHPARYEDAPINRTFHDMAATVGIEGYARQVEAIIGRKDSRPTLGEIKCPALVIAGADDMLIPPAMSHEIADGIKGARLETIPHCGHMPSMEMPATVTRLLGAFLS